MATCFFFETKYYSVIGIIRCHRSQRDSTLNLDDNDNDQANILHREIRRVCPGF